MYIGRIETTDGHLRDIPLELSPELNCVIGARGTCKSTIIETIRFVFDDDPARVQQLLQPPDGVEGPAHTGLIRATLKGGTGRLRLVAKGDAGDDRVTTVERDASSQARVYVDGVKSVDEPGVLNEIEIYSQGELQEIATSPAKRLALVDRPHKAQVEEWEKISAELAGEIAQLGPQIRELQESISSARRALGEGNPIRQELVQAQAARPVMSAEMAERRTRYRQREQLQTRAEDAITAHQAEAGELAETVGRLVAIAAGISDLTRSGSRLSDIAQLLAESAAAGVDLLERLPESQRVEAARDAARTEFEAESEAYHKILRKEQAVTDAIRREDRLGDEVRKLERIDAELARHQNRLAELESLRTVRRKELRELRTKIFRLRLDEVDRINSEFSDQIVLSLNHGTYSARYRARLDELLAGSRLRERGALCEQIAAALPPDKLVTFVDDDDAPGMGAVLNRDPGQMMRLISHLSETEGLYRLESEVADDELEITMFVEGSPRSVAEMSKGQKATAILPLLLRPADYPLVLDQPEDDLDNRFIFETLIEKIDSLKRKRQLIFVTHNANIPVIGDAERVFVMGMNGPERATLRGTGTVDDMRDEIVSLLEGGEKAFELRSRTYGYPANRDR